ncbi:MAG: hypothetical protein JXQ75_11780, partial [Phycisphaerae bacterium]|nr:hypothetical protein [Phycisphaerae bacterium]
CGTGVSPVVFTVRNGVSEPLFSLSPRAVKPLAEHVFRSLIACGDHGRWHNFSLFVFHGFRTLFCTPPRDADQDSAKT